MVFSSLVFIFIFLLVSVGVYYLLPGITLKNYWLIAVSLVFYAWGEPSFLLIMLASIALNYVFGLLIGSRQGGRRRLYFITALAMNLGLLAAFKYADFLTANLNGLLQINLPLPGLALPLGISFFTFQAMSYIIDLYRGQVPVQRNLSRVLLYISFFPQLVAGPIVRYTTIQEQILGRRHSLEKCGEGLRRFLIGLAKKVLIANQIAVMVDEIYGMLGAGPPILSMWLMIIGYALQIYFDFSGYSDMAIGLGKIFGFEFNENFNFPYISKSVTEFWRRWHISLGTWFRDYVYFPLGGSRVGRLTEMRNLLIVWFLTGMWHGASWNFIFWGLYYCLFIACERLFLSRLLSKNALLGHAYLVAVALFGWVLFRAETLPAALDIYRLLFGLPGNALYDAQSLIYLHDNWYILLAGLLLSTPLFRRPGAWLQQHAPRAFPLARAAFYTVVYLIIIMFMVNSSYNPFIYFRF